MDNLISVYKNIGDVFFYVNGPIDENELLFVTVLTGLQETLALLLRCVLISLLSYFLAQRSN